jgi:hypothetical protein
MSVGTGNVAYTGIGFQPRAVIFFGRVANGSINASSKGFDDGITGLELLDYTFDGLTVAFTNTANAIYLFDDSVGANRNLAVITSFDADGFTLAWTKVGSPTNTATIYYLAFK